MWVFATAMVGCGDKLRPPTQDTGLLTFLDDNVGEVHSAPSITDPTYNRGFDHNAPFERWFERPLQIAAIAWSPNTHISEGFNPWHLYFSHPEIYAKIKGFSRLRCKLHVKLVVNASPFQYSLGVMSYKPLSGTSEINPGYAGGQLDQYFTNSNRIPAMMSYTQHPHAHFEPQYSKGCQMELPFIYPMDWLPLINGDLDALEEMGRITLASYAILRNAGTASANPISVSVYAWASDVELAGPSFSLQSKDEYSHKPVSSTASAVAAASRALESVPAIAPFARATGTMATALGSLASAFGFSNPPVINPVSSVRINYAANLSSTDIPTQIEKLSLDPKNELCIDARTVGLDGVDHMSFKHIMDRDVFVTSFQWNAPDAPDTKLFSTFVNPSFHHVDPASGPITLTVGRAVQMTPSALLSTMFDHWRGPITLKFICASSQFHRGRLRISYDPQEDISIYTGSSLRVYQKVWDLSAGNTFEFEVPYMAASAWSRTYTEMVNGRMVSPTVLPPDTKYWADRNNVIPVDYDFNYFNGCIRVDVMNELTAPSATDVPIFVFVNTKNVEFANPTSGGATSCLSFGKLQSADDVTVADDIVHEAVPITENIDNSSNVFMGEKIVSIRQLIHRSSYWDTLRPGFTAASSALSSLPSGDGYSPLTNSGLREAKVKWVFPRLPMGLNLRPPSTEAATYGTSDGYPPWSVVFTDQTVGTADTYTYGSLSKTSPLAVFASCYVGWRGSMVWRAFMRGEPGDTSYMLSGGSTQVARLNVDDVYFDRDQLSCEPFRPMNNAASTNGGVASPWNVLQNGHVVSAVKQNEAPGTTPTDNLRWLNTIVKRIDMNPRSLFSGVSKMTPKFVPNVDAVFPHYSALRMKAGNPTVYHPDASGYSRAAEWRVDSPDTVSLNMTVSSADGGTPSTLSVPPIDLYHHAGVDFTMFMFLAVPTFWVYHSSVFTIPSVVYNDDVNKI